MYPSVNFVLPVICWRILKRLLNVVTNNIFACSLKKSNRGEFGKKMVEVVIRYYQCLHSSSQSPFFLHYF